MRIGILGTGGMADALGTQWRRAGHEVLAGGRSGPNSLAEAAEFGTDAVLVALPYPAVVEVAGGLQDALRGRVLVDCANAVAGPDFALTTRGGLSVAERIAAAVPTAHVVKAFNLCHVDVWRLTPPVFEGRPLAVPLCGDDEGALDVVRRLVRDVGCEPLCAGGVERAGLVEATAALLIRLWVGEGADAQAIAPPVPYAWGDSGQVAVPARDLLLPAPQPVQQVDPVGRDRVDPQVDQAAQGAGRVGGPDREEVAVPVDAFGEGAIDQ